MCTLQIRHSFMNIACNENVNENFDFEFLYCTDLKNKYHFWTYTFIWPIPTSIYDSLSRLLDTLFVWTSVLELHLVLSSRIPPSPDFSENIFSWFMQLKFRLQTKQIKWAKIMFIEFHANSRFLNSIIRSNLLNRSSWGIRLPSLTEGRWLLIASHTAKVGEVYTSYISDKIGCKKDWVLNVTVTSLTIFK